MNKGAFVCLTAWSIWPAPVIEEAGSIDEDITFFNKVLADLPIADATSRYNVASSIRTTAGDDPLLLRVVPLSFGDLPSESDVSLEMKAFRNVFKVLKNLRS